VEDIHSVLVQCEQPARRCRALISGIHRKVLDAEFFFAMGDACYRQQLHQQCVFAYESALEMGVAPKTAWPRRSSPPLTVCSCCTGVPVRTRRILLPGLATRPLTVCSYRGGARRRRAHDTEVVV